MPEGQIGAKPYLKEDYGNMPACGARKNKANSKPISVKKCQKCPIQLLAMELFELYQGDPVFVGVVGRLADGGLAGAGYFGFGAGLKRWRGRPGLGSHWHLASGRGQGQDALATARIVPLYGEGCRVVAQVQARRAAGWQIYGVNLAGPGEAVVVFGGSQLIMVGHFSERQVLMEKL